MSYGNVGGNAADAEQDLTVREKTRRCPLGWREEKGEQTLSFGEVFGEEGRRASRGGGGGT